MKRTKDAYWKRIYSRMQRDETNDFYYRKWFAGGGFTNFKKDVTAFPSIKHIVSKINKELPFSPTNYQWIVRPTTVYNSSRPRLYKPKMNYDCLTLKFIIKEDALLNKSGVYKITFDNDCFYIGSSKLFKNRVSVFVCSFNGTTKMHNKNMIKCVAECESATFEVLEYIDDLDKLKVVETKYIQEQIGNPLLLNRAHDAVSNKGIKWTEEEKLATKNTLIRKFKEGLIKSPNYYKTIRRKDQDKLFNSKVFGDKEK